MEVKDGIDPNIELAIKEGVRAGVFRAAARVNPKAAQVWSDFAADHTSKAATLLNAAMTRLGIGDPGPWPVEEW